MQKMLPTSIVGSLPKPSWLAQPETLWSPWNLRDDALAEGQQDALRIAVHEQRGRGIDIVSDGRPAGTSSPRSSSISTASISRSARPFGSAIGTTRTCRPSSAR